MKRTKKRANTRDVVTILLIATFVFAIVYLFLIKETKIKITGLATTSPTPTPTPTPAPSPGVKLCVGPSKLNYFKKESCKDPAGTNTDFCSSPIEITKFYCKNNACERVLKNCSDFGMVCSKEAKVCIEIAICGDGTCRADLGESCSSCSGDCGGCQSSGSSSGSTGTVCISQWDCVWGDCANNIQKQTCTDLKKCTTPTNKSIEKTRACTVTDCIDNDGDGYGIGKDCEGEDIDDNNPSLNVKKEEPLSLGDKAEKNREDRKQALPYLISGILLILVIAAIAFLILARYTKKLEKGVGVIEPTQSEVKEVFGNVSWKSED